MLRRLDELYLEFPYYGSRRFAVVVAREFGRPINRKRIQRLMGILGIEALACGTPVIVADSGGTRDWSTAGCIRVPQGEVEAMAAAVSRLGRDPELARSLGEFGREAVGARFGPPVIWPLLQELYREVA